MQREIVETLRPMLNSERIHYLFGSYGVEVLTVDSSHFPGGRITNLYSLQDGLKVMRTLVIVDFRQPIHKALLDDHQEILEGRSIAQLLSGKGWKIKKESLHFGKIAINQNLLAKMQVDSKEPAAFHIYRLCVSKNEGDFDIPYGDIIEIHSPRFLTEGALRLLYPDDFDRLVPLAAEADLLLRRVSNLLSVL